MPVDGRGHPIRFRGVPVLAPRRSRDKGLDLGTGRVGAVVTGRRFSAVCISPASLGVELDLSNFRNPVPAVGCSVSLIGELIASVSNEVSPVGGPGAFLIV